MLRINQLRLPVGHSKEELIRRVQKVLRCREVPEITIVRRSVDARKKPELYFNYILNIKVSNQGEIYRRCDRKQVEIWEEKPYHFPVEGYRGKERPIIIGTGPAGLFCGYMLANAGFHPILLERGKSVKQRTLDVQQFWETGNLNPESNVQFGEGGAGTFSDGKLNTLVKDKYGRNREVLSLFVRMGAPEEILYDHKPHIGTDVLCKVVENIRLEIERLGGEVRFEAKVTELLTEKDRVSGVVVNDREVLTSGYVVLAPGHSARDTFSMLYGKKLDMEAKPFAVGMRVEHLQKTINKAQYGKEEEPLLGNAPYKVTAKAADGRGVYSFCMCPGGFVVNASSNDEQAVVNGMSNHGRNEENANSAIVVNITPDDFCAEGFDANDVLAGVKFQEKYEKLAFLEGKGCIPVQLFKDFEANKTSTSISDIQPNIKGKYRLSNLKNCLPAYVNNAIIEAVHAYAKKLHGFDKPEAVLSGIESRTSSPVRIIRNEQFMSDTIGIFPCGEGAGYAGGITSAAVDGIKVAEAVAQYLIKQETDNE